MSALEKLKNRLSEVTSAGMSTIKMIKVSEEVAQSRMNICQSCEYLVKPVNTCSKCGCFMNLKTKLSNVQCPIQKW
jgi:hypothetical protein